MDKTTGYYFKNAKELSTGNLLSHEGEIIKVTKINMSIFPEISTYNQTFDHTEIEPIQLTDEIIKQSGYKPKVKYECRIIKEDDIYGRLKRDLPNPYYLFVYKDHRTTLKECELPNTYKFWCSSPNGFCSFKLQYLHELQNSFYWATRDDLDVSKVIGNKENKNALETI